jgi:hypothetical protein
MWDLNVLYAHSSSKDEHLLLRSLKKQKYEYAGRLKVKICVLFNGDNSRIVALRQIKFSTVQIKE